MAFQKAMWLLKIRMGVYHEAREQSFIESFRGDCDFLSNFYVCMIEYKGVWYQSAEAAFDVGCGGG